MPKTHAEHLRMLFAVVAISLINGCMPVPGYAPIGMPGRPVYPIPIGPGTAPPGYPASPAGYPVTGNLPTSTPPAVPTGPGSPGVPTIPISNPDPTPASPTSPTSPGTIPSNYRDYWVAWPLPTSGRSVMRSAAHSEAFQRRSTADDTGHGRPMRATVKGGSVAAEQQHETAGLPGRRPSFGERVSDLPATPSEDLHYRGGHTIPHLQFVNLYVGGDDAWSKSDVESIDRAISAAMSDRNLNNVMMQYFNNQPITSQALPSHPLTGYRPKTMTQGDVEYCLEYLASKGYLQGYDLSSTVFNFLLPSGTVLTDDATRQGTLASTEADSKKFGTFASVQEFGGGDGDGDEDDNSPIPHAEESSSLYGLGGYHGSIRRNGIAIYYSVDVYSQRLSNGQTNGIPVFSEPWKNVCATLYHELNEARTDPDVEDAIRNPTDARAEQFLGWTSNRGEECGDYPIDEARQLGQVVREVPLTDGNGTVPVQFQYSNAVHGPEGPISAPHPL
ncbi:MAG: hypothetical protein U0996_06230 [Planctomycetaceae bacterium]